MQNDRGACRIGELLLFVVSDRVSTPVFGYIKCHVGEG